MGDSPLLQISLILPIQSLLNEILFHHNVVWGEGLLRENRFSSVHRAGPGQTNLLFTRRLPFDPQKIILDRWNGPLDVAPPRKVHGENPREGEEDASFLADTTLKF